MAISEQLKQTVGKALGRVPSGLYILTCRHEQQVHGMLVSWVQQAAFDPPALSVTVAKGRAAGELIQRSGRLALSILGQEDVALMKRFARSGGAGEADFEGLNMMQTEGGLPVLADALAYLDCQLLRVCDFGADHDLFIVQVVGGNILKDGAAFTHQRGNGFHY